MRIAFITVGDPTRLTGGYLYHARLFAGLRARGVQVEELVAAPADTAGQRAAAETFGRTFDPLRYDAIVIDALARSVCAPHADRWRTLRPLVVLVHELPSIAGDGDPDEEAPLLRADRLVAVSRHGQAILLERGADPQRVAVVSPGYDRLVPGGWPLAGAGLREGSPSLKKSSSHKHQGELLVLSVAQWIVRKGMLELVTAWAACPRPGARLVLVGETSADADYTAQVHAAIAAAPPACPITIAGTVTDDQLADRYASAALFALPSRYEGYGMAFAEALGYGLPILACAVGPLPELVGEGGLLVPPGDVASLTAALNRLLDDTELRTRLAEAALRRAATLPSWETTVEQFLDVVGMAIGL